MPESKPKDEQSTGQQELPVRKKRLLLTRKLRGSNRGVSFIRKMTADQSCNSSKFLGDEADDDSTFLSKLISQIESHRRQAREKKADPRSLD